MKNILPYLLLLVSANFFGQNITVSQNSYTPAQLVQNVLVKNSCLTQVSNVSSRTGTNFGYTNGNGIGYFNNNNSDFPIQRGVVLSTGNAMAARGPNTSISSFTAPAWAGDADLEAALQAQGIAINSKDATVLEFDFIASSPKFGFSFLFASEEYGTYQCESKDAFAFLLTDLVTGVTTNMAVVPGTTYPITVSNIRNMLYNSGDADCASLNPEYFGSFFGGSTGVASAANFEGQTVVMMHASSSTLVTNRAYHIKLVVADDGRSDGTDGTYDSAVFLPEESFNLGQRLFEQDMTLANGNALCFGQSYVLDTELDPAVYGFSWTRNGVVMAGQTGVSITVTEPGTYEVTLTRADIAGCVGKEDIIIEYGDQIVAGNPKNIYTCQDGATSFAYNLAENTPLVKTGLNPAVVVSYHNSEAEAVNGTNALPLVYNSEGNETIWVRIKSHNSSCYVIKSFQLLLALPPVVNTPASPIIECENVAGSNTALFDLTQKEDEILGSPQDVSNLVAYFTSLENAENHIDPIATPESFEGENQTIYVKVYKDFSSSCYTIIPFDIVVKPLPILVTPDPVAACNVYELPELTIGNYYTEYAGTGTMLAPGTEITESQTIYIYARSGGDPDCANQVSFEVTIIDADSAPDDIYACGSYTLPALTSGEYRTERNGGGTIIPEGTVINSTTTVYYYIPSAASCTADSSFEVNITPRPILPQPTPISVCENYVLPELTVGNYFTEPEGEGLQRFPGFVVSASTILYIYAEAPDNPDCNAEATLQIDITKIELPDFEDIDACKQYRLPVLAVGNYYTLPDGRGAIIPAGTIITENQTIYVYEESSVSPYCVDQASFTVTIHEVPVLAPVRPEFKVCPPGYILPPLEVGNYYTAPNGQGQMLNVGDLISNTQLVYIYAEIGDCSAQTQFKVTIIEIIKPQEVTRCDSYTLPPLVVGDYYKLSGGPTVPGQEIYPQGYIVEETQLFFIYAISDDMTCSDEEEFSVIIIDSPEIVRIPNVVTCYSYLLPPLAVGNYYSRSDGLSPIDTSVPITSTRTVYVYAETGTTPNCETERSFRVTILNDDIIPADVTVCGKYVLPPLSMGKYYANERGMGNEIPEGTEITSSQRIYVYIPVTHGANCTDTHSFYVTVLPILADNPGNSSHCFIYYLPALTNGRYFTESGGTGTEKFAGDEITTTTTLYVYNEIPGIDGCIVENEFKITINKIAVIEIPDQLVCENEGYRLQPLTVGNYYTQPNGGGERLPFNQVIRTNQTVYIYAETRTTPVCTAQSEFIITVKPAPVVDKPANVGICGNYILPVLTSGNYYTGPAGTGTLYLPGRVISEDEELYIYAETGGIPNCYEEHKFTIIINPKAPDSVTRCDSYILPELVVGKYYTGRAGTGDEIAPGTIITNIQDIYVYVQMDVTPNCTDDNKFTVTIIPSPQLDDFVDISECDSYTLPPLTLGDYYKLSGGPGVLGQVKYDAGHVILDTETIYVYAETGSVPNCTDEESFVVTISKTPVLDARSDTPPTCHRFRLNDLTVGNYYKLSGGPDAEGQVQYNIGEYITESQTVYIYAESSDNPNCSAETSFYVTIVTITPDEPEDVDVCDSTNYILPALKVGNYYKLSGGPNVANQERYEPGYVVTETQTFYIYAETGGRVNCSNENPFTVTVHQTPVVDKSITEIAECDEYYLPVLAVGNYFAEPRGVNPIDSTRPIVNTQTVYVYASVGPDKLCWDEHSFVVTINRIEVDRLDSTTACGQFILPDLYVGNYFTGQNGTGTPLYAGNPITTSQTIYIFGQTNTTPNCTDESEFTITIVETPVAGNPQDIAVCDTDNDGFAEFNITQAITEAINGQADVTATVYESMEDAVNNVNPINTNSYTNTIRFRQTVYIKVASTLTDNCYDVVAVQLIVNPLPVPQPTATAVCIDANGRVTKRAVITAGIANPDNYTYIWYGVNGEVIAGQTGHTISVSAPGDYDVVAINKTTLCESYPVSVTVIESTPPVSRVIVNDAFSENNIITVITEGLGDYLYSLDNGPWRDNGGVFTNVTVGQHTITVMDKYGCGVEGPLNVQIISYPKFFTPNGDGYNDIWNIDGMRNQPNAEIYIYDRYGKIMTKISPSRLGWDGTYNGHQMPATDYWFSIKYQENGEEREFKAHFSLKR